MDFEIAVPTNFTDAGRLLGLFEIRNTIEAVLLCLPILFLTFMCFSFGITAKIIIAVSLCAVIGGFALIGIGDSSLLQFLKQYRDYHKKRGILTYRGEVIEKT